MFTTAECSQNLLIITTDFGSASKTWRARKEILKERGVKHLTIWLIDEAEDDFHLFASTAPDPSQNRL